MGTRNFSFFLVVSEPVSEKFVVTGVASPKTKKHIWILASHWSLLVAPSREPP